MKLRIKNKFKFVMSTSILFIIIICIVLSMISSTYSYVEVKYKDIMVSTGETLWSIASEEKKYNEYYKDRDIRYIVDDIKLNNDLGKGYLQVGQILVIPTY